MENCLKFSNENSIYGWEVTTKLNINTDTIWDIHKFNNLVSLYIFTNWNSIQPKISASCSNIDVMAVTKLPQFSQTLKLKDNWIRREKFFPFLLPEWNFEEVLCENCQKELKIKLFTWISPNCGSVLQIVAASSSIDIKEFAISKSVCLYIRQNRKYIKNFFFNLSNLIKSFQKPKYFSYYILKSQFDYKWMAVLGTIIEILLKLSKMATVILFQEF